jgi:uncharacterized protein YecE (DUF72 family)
MRSFGHYCCGMKTHQYPKIGTCSWKYESWKGLVYSKPRGINYLQEYSQKYLTVEIDQWFWSLFKGNTVVLPKPEVVKEYAASVPQGFLFSIKVPNSITLTHHYAKKKNAPLETNPYFLSTELMERFLKSIEPMGDHIGPLMFQFEYLNKEKMAGLGQFIERFETFRRNISNSFQYCIEIRNPNFLNEKYFSFLAKQQMGHVFLQGYYMPSIFLIYSKFKKWLQNPLVIRLHGGDRRDIEELTHDQWDTIVDPKDDDLALLGDLVEDTTKQGFQVFINVNNHYEGSAPKTIERINGQLESFEIFRKNRHS